MGNTPPSELWQPSPDLSDYYHEFISIEETPFEVKYAIDVPIELIIVDNAEELYSTHAKDELRLIEEPIEDHSQSLLLQTKNRNSRLEDTRKEIIADY